TSYSAGVYIYFFFFQAEDGIRDGHVTGVQTCALPIFLPLPGGLPAYPKEPVGYTAFAEHNFSTPITQTAPTATGLLGLWSIDDTALLSNMTNVQDFSAPQSPASVFQGKFPAGLQGGFTSIKWE